MFVPLTNSWSNDRLPKARAQKWKRRGMVLGKLRTIWLALPDISQWKWASHQWNIISTLKLNIQTYVIILGPVLYSAMLSELSAYEWSHTFSQKMKVSSRAPCLPDCALNHPILALPWVPVFLPELFSQNRIKARMQSKSRGNDRGIME